MPEPLKNIYDEQFIRFFTSKLRSVYPQFDSEKYIDQLFDSTWDNLELKARMNHIAVTLHFFLPQNFSDAVEIIMALIDLFDPEQDELAFGYMFLPHYIELYGLDQYEISVPALKKITEFTSCEFAVRPFIIHYEEKMIAELLQWCHSGHSSVRRCASEGCRPRLPWAIALPAFKSDPTDILPILEKLKDDESEFVRRSVANNLNDISRDNPTKVKEIAEHWIGENSNRDKCVKHACRTLLKAGDPEIMQLFGFGATKDITIETLTIDHTEIPIGETSGFSFSLCNNSNSSCKIRLEYALHYLRSNGSHSKKVFKISEKEYGKNSTTQIQRQISFRVITTRKYYVGRQFLSIIVNGVEFEKVPFELM